MQPTRSYDVIVVGAGMIGLSCALQLSKLNLSVAVVEKRSLQTQPPSHLSSKVSALTLQSQQYLHDCQVMSQLEPVSCFYDHMSVWDGEGSANIDFCADAIGLAQLGCIVENQHIEHQLLLQLQATSEAILHNQSISELKQETNHVELQLNDQRILALTRCSGW